jgi:EAL domain-containing protein (putative c-di-GMP-specific phosphodiesterase class I)
VQLLQADFQSEVKRVLRETGFPPYLLCLELTESLFIGKSVRKAKATLENLKLLGVSLALDDFGTGYSSLSYLEKLPFDKIKIDRSFVSGIETDANKRSLLGGIISLGQTLGRIIVVEGAETQGEVSLLRDLGADIVQGYALCRPLPADQAIVAAQTVAREFPVKFGGNTSHPGRTSVTATLSS